MGKAREKNQLVAPVGGAKRKREVGREKPGSGNWACWAAGEVGFRGLESEWSAT